MKNTELLFNKAIRQYEDFIEKVTALEKELSSLTPEEIFLQCQQLEDVKENITPDDKKITDAMKLIGSDIFDTPYIGEYQRILEKAEKVCADLSAKANVHKTLLAKELSAIKKSQKGLAGYAPKEEITGKILTKNF